MTNGVPQGSVLAPIMFLVYINYINENIETGSCMNMFADDAKIQKNYEKCGIMLETVKRFIKSICIG